MKTAVAQTSIDHYRRTDFGTLRYRIAITMLIMTREGDPCYIRSVASFCGLDKSTVAGRMNELRKAPFRIGGDLYHIISAGTYVDRQPGKRPVTVNTWKMVPYTPAAATQAELFQTQTAAQ